MKAALYQLASFASWHCGLGRSTARENVAIFMVHGVHNQEMAAIQKPPASSMPIETFAAGIQSLLQRYTIVSLDQAVDMLAGRVSWRPRCVVLTFDDSLKCLVRSAAAWLSHSGLTATFYVSTEAIDSQRPYWWKRLEYAMDRSSCPQAQLTLPGGRQFTIRPRDGYYSLGDLKAELKKLPVLQIESAIDTLETQLNVKLNNGDSPYTEVMSWDDVKELTRLGMTVGSHSVSHPNLSILPLNDLRGELARSREIIEVHTGIACRHFCYPYGGYSESACNIAGNVGYASAVTTIGPGWNCLGADPFRLRRFGLPLARHRSTFVLSGIPELALRKRSGIPLAFPAGSGTSLSA